MKFIGKKSIKCDSCGAYKYNVPCYEWFSLIDNRFIGTICKRCASRELFGSNYKKSKRYEKWTKENE